jgi:hypothetical protein
MVDDPPGEPSPQPSDELPAEEETGAPEVDPETQAGEPTPASPKDGFSDPLWVLVLANLLMLVCFVGLAWGVLWAPVLAYQEELWSRRLPYLAGWLLSTGIAGRLLVHMLQERKEKEEPQPDSSEQEAWPRLAYLWKVVCYLLLPLALVLGTPALLASHLRSEGHNPLTVGALVVVMLFSFLVAGPQVISALRNCRSKESSEDGP